MNNIQSIKDKITSEQIEKSKETKQCFQNFFKEMQKEVDDKNSEFWKESNESIEKGYSNVCLSDNLLTKWGLPQCMNGKEDDEKISQGVELMKQEYDFYIKNRLSVYINTTNPYLHKNKYYANVLFSFNGKISSCIVAKTYSEFLQYNK